MTSVLAYAALELTGDGATHQPGHVVKIDRYTSMHAAFDALAKSGTLFLATPTRHEVYRAVPQPPPEVLPSSRSGCVAVRPIGAATLSSGAYVKRALVAMVLACAVSACTVLAPSATAAVIATHNGVSDGRWDYGAPVAISVLVGLGIDVVLVQLHVQWAKPMT